MPDFTFDPHEIHRANDLARLGELTRSARERRRDPGQLPQIAQTYADLAERSTAGDPQRAELLALAATTWSLAGYQANASALAGAYLRELQHAAQGARSEGAAAAAPAAIAQLAARILQRDIAGVARLGAVADERSRAIGSALLSAADGNALDDADAVLLAVYGLTGRAARSLARYWRTGQHDAGTRAVDDLRRACALLLHAGVVDTWVLLDNLSYVVEDVVTTSPWRLLRRASSWNGLWRRYLRSLAAAERPVVQVWPSQRRVLDNGLLERGNPNLTVTMPTSAGKTHVAEWAILHALAAAPPFAEPLAAYIVPTRALAAQVERDFNASLSPVGLRVSGLFGGFEHVGFEQQLVASTDVLVVTSEKFDLLLRNDEAIADRLALLVVDEGHLIGEDERGLRLELVLTRVRRTITRARILLLSAVLPNADEIAAWLDPEQQHVAQVDWSPSALRMGVFRWRGAKRDGQHGTVEYRSDDAEPGFFVPYILTRRIPKRSALFPVERRDIAAELAIHYQKLGPVLISIARKISVPTSARAVLAAAAAAGVALGADDSGSVAPHVAAERAYLADLVEEFCGTGHELADLVMKGIGYHHADVPQEVRLGLEHAYRSGALRVLCATSTLSQGVNLPTKTVIVSGTSIGENHRLAVRDFRNTAGRAGRPFQESEGHVVLVSTDEREAARLRERYIDNPALEPVISALGRLYVRLVQARLGAIRPESIAPWYEVEDPGDERLARRSEIFDLQLLVSLAEEIVDTPDEVLLHNSVQDLLADTLGARQLTARLVETAPLVRFAVRRVRAAAARVPDARLRGAYLRTGLSLSGCESARSAAVAVLDAIYRDPELLLPDRWTELRALVVDQSCTVPEMQRAAREQKVTINAVPPLALDWMDGQRIDELRNRHARALGVDDPMRFATALDRVVVHDLAWVLSAVLQLINHDRGEPFTGDLAALPAMAKYGVNSLAACFAASIGVRSRQDAIALARMCPPEDSVSLRAFLQWVTVVGPTLGEDVVSHETIGRLSARSAVLLTPRDAVVFAADEEGWILVPLRGIRQLGTVDLIRTMRRGEPVVLRRERDNPADVNAIAVSTIWGQRIGYLAREYARVLAPMLDTEGTPPLNAALWPTLGPDQTERHDAVQVLISIES